jgi:HD domain
MAASWIQNASKPAALPFLQRTAACHVSVRCYVPLMARDQTLHRLIAALRSTGRLSIAEVDLDPRDLDKLNVPDTRAARHAEDICRAVCDAPLVNHSYRTYAWGALLGVAERRAFDAELLYVAALLHDIGLTERFDRGGCFESDGADAANELLIEVGWPSDRAQSAARAIYLHMHEVDEADGPEALLLSCGASLDVTGRRFDEIDGRARNWTLDVYPRASFKQRFLELLSDQAARKPQCTVHTYMDNGLGDRILAAPFSD